LFLIGWFLKKKNSLKPLCQMNQTLVGIMYGMSSIKIAHFVLIRSQTWPPQAILIFDWLISKKKSYPLKLLGKMNRNLVGSIYGMSSLKIVHFSSICLQAWPPQTILVSDWSIFKKSSLLKPCVQMSWNLVGSIYGRFSIKIVHFVLIRSQTWTPQTILLSDRLISKKSSPLKRSSQMNSNLVGSTYGRFCIKFPENRMKGEWPRLTDWLIFLHRPPFPISAPTIILLHSYSLPFLLSPLPTPPLQATFWPVSALHSVMTWWSTHKK
jgi:hypothetical protein